MKIDTVVYIKGTGTADLLNVFDGMVLIGQDSGDAFNADSMLRIQRTGDRVFQQFKCDADQNVQILFGDVDDDVECTIQYHPSDKDLRFTTGNNAEALRLDSSQRVIVASGGAIHFSGNTSTGFIYETGANLQLRSDGAMTFYTYSGGWQVRMTIADGGLISGDFNDTSDVALKENIVAIDDGMSIISQMRPVSFDWRDVVAEDKDGNEVTVPSGKGSTKGLIAQEVEAIDAELVVGEEGEKAINTSGVLAYAIKAIQEQQTIIDDLKSRIETLENN